MPPSLKIMVATDHGYLRYAPTCLNAIRSSTPGDIEIGFVAPELDDALKAKIRAACPGLSITFLTLDISALDGLRMAAHLTPFSYARIFMPDLIDWERFIYLDIDAIATGDLRELWSHDLGDAPAASALSMDGKHFNTGVLIVNAAVWRESGLAHDLAEYGIKHQPKYADQDAINHVIGDQLSVLDSSWNSIFSPLSFYAAGFTRERMNEVAVMHYTTAFKPWNLGRLLMPKHVRRPWDDNFTRIDLPRDWSREWKTAVNQASILFNHYAHRLAQKLKRQFKR